MSQYRVAELHRLRGAFQKAEEMYRRASQAGHTAHPGLALLRLAQGQIETADVAIHHELQERRGPAVRAQVLRAAVEIMLAAKDVAGARAAAEELTRTASRLERRFYMRQARRPRAPLRWPKGTPPWRSRCCGDACAVWRELDAPYEWRAPARSSGLAYRELGDDEGAQMELEAAAEGFDRLGAAPDAARVPALLTTAPSSRGDR